MLIGKRPCESLTGWRQHVDRPTSFSERPTSLPSSDHADFRSPRDVRRGGGRQNEDSRWLKGGGDEEGGGGKSQRE